MTMSLSVHDGMAEHNDGSQMPGDNHNSTGLPDSL